MQTSGKTDAEFDAIVIGVGGMGSAACYALARRGLRILGLDRFPLVHNQGSSHGESRIIRKAYFEHPDYVPLLHRAYELWHDLERVSGQKLLRQTGLVLSGTADGETIRGTRLSAEQHHLELQNLSANEAKRRFPGFAFPSHHDVAFEPIAGTLFVEDCVRAHIDGAVQRGAIIRGSEPVTDWSSDGKSVCVRTATREYRARSLVITSGAWAAECLRDLQLPLTVVRKFVGWFPHHNDAFLADRGCPAYFFELPHGTFYGIPGFDSTTIKVAEHSGGEIVTDLDRIDRSCHPGDLVRLQSFLTDHLPGVDPEPARYSVCLYTLTPDRHFAIDLHPKWNNVSFAAGFSGHGFKFCPVVGEALADLVQQGTAALPIGFPGGRREGG